MDRGDNNNNKNYYCYLCSENQWAVGMEMASAAEVVPAVEMVKEFLRDPGPTAVTPLFSMVVRQVL